MVSLVEARIKCGQDGSKGELLPCSEELNRETVIDQGRAWVEVQVTRIPIAVRRFEKGNIAQMTIATSCPTRLPKPLIFKMLNKVTPCYGQVVQNFGLCFKLVR